MNTKPTISLLQFFILAINITFGGSMLTVPEGIAAIAKEDMWISVILGGAVILFSFGVSVKLSQYFPMATSVEYHRILLGNIGGQVLNIILLVLMVMITASFLRVFRTAVNIYLLDLTPPNVIVLILMLLAVYATQYGLAPILRLQQFLFVPSYMLFIAIAIFGFMAIDSNNYKPILAEGIAPVLKGTKAVWTSYSGPEILIGFIYPYLHKRDGAFKWGGTVIFCITILYALITLITQGILGANETAHIIIPTAAAYRDVEIPDTFVERLDGYLMIIWVVVCFIALANWLYFIAALITKLFELEEVRSVVVLLMPLIYYITVALYDINLARNFAKWTNLLGTVWGLGILPLLLCIVWLRKRKREKDDVV